MIERLLGADPERTAILYVLVLARTLPLSFLAPWLGWRGTASYVRVATAAVLAAALVPIADASAAALPAPWLGLSLAAIREALVGATFAISVSVPLYAMGWTGDLIDRWRGSPPDSTVVDAAGTSPLGTLHLAASVVLFVLIGGHRLALAAFAQGLSDLPAGATAEAASLSALGLGSAQIVGSALTLTVAFVAPAAIAFVALEVTLGLWSRAAPAVRVWMEAMPLRAALGVAIALLSLSAVLPRLGPVFSESIETASSVLRGPW